MFEYRATVSNAPAWATLVHAALVADPRFAEVTSKARRITLRFEGPRNAAWPTDALIDFDENAVLISLNAPARGLGRAVLELVESIVGRDGGSVSFDER